MIGLNTSSIAAKVIEMKDPAMKNNAQALKSSNDFLKAHDKIQYDFKDDRTLWTSKGRASDYEIFSGKNIGFDKTSPRFNYNQVFYG